MKKEYIVLLLLIFCVAQIMAATCGDVNSSGTVDIVDALMTAQYVVSSNPQNFDPQAADVDGDGTVTIVDALLMAQYSVGIISSFAGCTSSSPTPTPTPTSTFKPTTIFAVNCGGSAYTGADGTKYAADTGYSGGSTTTNSKTIADTSDPTLYHSERYGNCSYSASALNGDYLVTLYFAENYHTSSGLRTFNVMIEGTQAISNLDIYAMAGGSTAYVTKNQVAVTDGEINIDLVTVKENALINAIKVEVIALSGDPVVKFTVSPSNPKPNETVTVDASASYDPDGTIVSYKVDYGDGYIANSAVSSHAYASEGKYTLTLTVTDNEDKTSSAVKTLSVGVKPTAACAVGKDIAKRIATNTYNRAPNTTYYAVACIWYGTLTYAGLTQDSSLVNKSTSVYIDQRPTGSVDDNIYGIWPLELYQRTNNTKYRDTGVYLADEEFNPTSSEGLSKYTRYWADDLYMICSLQVQAYKATNNIKYLDRCKLQFEAYFKALQQSNGLFYHTRNAHFFWGRANGWAASAMTEALMVMPQSHAGYNSIMTAYKSMMAALKKYQDSTGMWHQVITNPSSYLETSCTGMFLFAQATGVRMGWLPADEYLPVVEKGINALNGYVSADGMVRNICIGTGEGTNEQFYLDRPTSTGDYHGQAGVIWGATAVMRLCE